MPRKPGTPIGCIGCGTCSDGTITPFVSATG
jgi:hypothetical protein